MISLVSQVDVQAAGAMITRTYKILPGPPPGKSYARDIAFRYKIGFEQLISLLKEKGVPVSI